MTTTLRPEHRNYARAMLTQLLEPAFYGAAPGSNKPYVRAELEFPSDQGRYETSHVNRLRQAAGTASLVASDIRSSNTIDPDIRVFADAARDAVAFALNDERYTVEAAVLKEQGDRPGTQVSLFIYDSSGSHDQLRAKLTAERQTILARFDSRYPQSPNKPR